MSCFQLVGLDHEPFKALFLLDDSTLRDIGAVRCIATGNPGFPCRVSLEDAVVGDELLLLPHVHQPGDSPYRSSGPIFVRRDARKQALPAGIVPPYVTRRLISLRAYDAAHMMLDADVCEGEAVAAGIERQFAIAGVEYIHLHNARRGCFSCKVVRTASAC